MSAFVILPTQLCPYPKSFWKQWDEVVVIEDKYYVNRKQHPLKLWMYRSSMREYFDRIPTRSKRYIEYSDSFKLPSRFTMCHPIDEPMVSKYRNGTFLDPPNFVLSLDELRGMDTPIQSVFYKRMRINLDILMKNGKPLGGKWSFDSENRSRYPDQYRDVNLLDRGHSNKYISSSKAITSLSMIKLRIDHLPWPTNRLSALKRLREFVKQRLPSFGPYQDAMRRDVLLGSHSGISASLNIGLITPSDVLKEISKSKAPIQSAEALIRQIIGWREFIRMRYMIHGLHPWTYLKRMNRKLDRSWYAGTTGIETLDWSIDRVLTYAYAPHIERLMLLLNYSILMRFRYEDVRQWFISCFIDATGEWQMLNIEMGVSSLSKHKFMTRVYLNSGKYLRGQGLDISKPDMEHLTQLYESFIIDNKDLVKRDYRLASAVKRLTK